jgi:uncharacterized protein (DUF488 family)
MSKNTLSTLYTIGHSTRTLDELVAALRAHGVATLVDIRAFPMSRRMPHFNRESLEVELPKRGLRYVWMKELGGHRKKIRNDSPNTGLRNDSFRNYADYMLTAEFAQAIGRLLKIAEETKSAPTLSPKEGEEDGAPEGLDPTLSPKEGEEDGAPEVSFPVTLSPILSASAADEDGAPEANSGNTAYMCAERVYFQCHRMLVSDYLTAHGHTVLHIDDEKRTPRPHKLMAEAHLADGKLLYNAQELF